MIDTTVQQREPAAAEQRDTTFPMSAPRLGFAGVGWIGRNRMEAIAQAGAGEIAAIYDPVEAAAEQAAGCAPQARIAGSFEALLDSELDGIVIATPSALHAEQAIAALQGGKAVFCQKPLGRNAREVHAVLAAACEANRLLSVDLSYRHTIGMQRIRELIRSGALGRIYAIEAVFHNAYGPDKPWFYDPLLSGGGCLLDLGVHLVDLASWCLDFPALENVTGHLLNRTASAAGAAERVEDYAAAQVFFAGSVSLQLACSWKAPAGCDADIRMTFFGSEGGASFRNVDGSFYDFVAEHFRADRSRITLAAPPDAWPGRAAVAWAQQLGRAPHFDPECELLANVAETLDRIYGRIP
jgi:predicted dehydrogenase